VISKKYAEKKIMAGNAVQMPAQEAPTITDIDMVSLQLSLPQMLDLAFGTPEVKPRMSNASRRMLRHDSSKMVGFRSAWLTSTFSTISYIFCYIKLIYGPPKWSIAANMRTVLK